MLLQNLDRKEKLKFLDLALLMINVDGPISEVEQKLLDLLIAEIGTEITAEYNFSLSSDLQVTLDFFIKQPLNVRNIVYFNLLQLALIEDFYNTCEHFFLEDVAKQLKINKTKKTEFIRLIHAMNDVLEKVKETVND